MGSTASAAPPTEPGEIPVPKGLQSCSSDDPVATAESRLATKLGGEYLGCFQSLRTADLSVAPASTAPIEYAFALSLKGREYKLADLDSMLSTVRQQWNNFDPLSNEFKESYLARLNALIKDNGSTSSQGIASVAPILISIDRNSEYYYTVTSIRSYVVDVNGRQIKSTRVNADAIALRGSQIIRLTIQRTMGDADDVAKARAEIADWAQATIKM